MLDLVKSTDALQFERACCLEDRVLVPQSSLMDAGVVHETEVSKYVVNLKTHKLTCNILLSLSLFLKFA